ncbi:MAG: cytochrome c family protein [Rhodobacteraceae bacterium]|nr:cytochrome c family protein [Paracoccaceae bacterium]
MKALIPAILLIAISQPAAAQDTSQGETVFKKCKSCHMIGPEAKNKTGPNLTGVIGRPAGTYEGYKYSKSMRAVGEGGLIWDEDQLFAYLENPTKYLRKRLDNRKAKAKMSLKLRDEDDRKNVIAYLATYSVAAEDSHQVCVVNSSKHEYYFAAEASGGLRKVGKLAPGETLCSVSGSSSTGVVSVYEDPENLEGCSRLVTSGQTEGLIKYADFDRCAWSSNS